MLTVAVVVLLLLLLLLGMGQGVCLIAVHNTTAAATGARVRESAVEVADACRHELARHVH